MMHKKLSCACALLLLGGSFGPATAAQRTAAKHSQARAERKRARAAARERAELHARILRGENWHDDAGALAYVGDFSSVPVLLPMLKETGPLSKESCQKSGDNGHCRMTCTAAHIIFALRKITKHDAGEAFNEWNSWWEQYQQTNLRSNK